MNISKSSRRLAIKAARRMAPRTLSKLRLVSTLDPAFGYGAARFVTYERELRALRREIDALRRDNRRVAELYDVVFEWAKSNAGGSDSAGESGRLGGGAFSAPDADATVERVAAALAEHDRVSPAPS